jgi:hypothetical protein
VTEPKMPFPQLSDEAFTSPAAFVAALLDWSDATDAKRPHIALTYDPETKRFFATGPFPDADQASEDLRRSLQAMNKPENNDGVPLLGIIVPIFAP